MSNLIHNERVKLRAALWNGMAIGAFIGGIFLPLIARHETSPLAVFLTLSVGMVLAICMHGVGIWTLRRMRE